MKSVLSWAVVGAMAISINTGCSSSSSDGVSSLNSIGAIPDASSLVAAASSSSTSMSYFASTGTPPLLADLKDIADDAFWGGLVDAINSNSVGNLSDPDIWRSVSTKFFGGSDGAAGGSGACQMAQSVGEAMRRIVINTTCYVKEMAREDTVTVEPAVSDRSVIFAQEAQDKLVRVNVVNDPFSEEGDGEESMAVNITVVGSENLSGNIYQLKLTICNGGNPREYELITVNRDTKEFTSSSARSESGGGGSGTNTSSISAFLKVDENGDIAFDTSKLRTGTSVFSGNFGGQSNTHMSKVEIDGSTMRIWGKGTGPWGSNNNYAIASFTGSNAATLRFYEGAYKGIHTPDSSCSGCQPHEYSGQAEWRDDDGNGEGMYAATTSGAFDSEISSYSLDDDSFYDGSSTPDVSVLSTLTCEGTAAYTLDMDFSNPAIAAIQETCDGRGLEGNFYDLCYSNDVRTAEQTLFSSQPR